MHLRQKARPRLKLSTKFCNFRPEPDPKSPARLATMSSSAVNNKKIISASEDTQFNNELMAKFQLANSEIYIQLGQTRKVNQKMLTSLKNNEYFIARPKFTDFNVCNSIN